MHRRYYNQGSKFVHQVAEFIIIGKLVDLKLSCAVLYIDDV